eukprot:gb/GEZN01003797.1/.p1 GENE.gb/GEZN01003797.1/~~gb/GEZN01003797.1/.p1  ORF type:complete len:655 (-),score=44.46 gb/GEZN01003797.1/:106-2070(-)
MWAMLLALLVGIVRVSADLYLHNPRGSNNRLAEEDANRNNGDRLFDSQNNNRGGYNVGVKTFQHFTPGEPFFGPAETFDASELTKRMQYQFAFFEESTLTWEWTNQHGCGGNEATDPYKLNCNLVLQYMCDHDASAAFPDTHMNVDLRDGGNTNTPSEATTYSSIQNTIDDNKNNQRGHHENEAYYLMCDRKQRNYRLFHADQNVNTPSTRGTRQNNNGNRRGLECPEERDYYPWWNPSPWRDVAYLTDHAEEACPRVAAGSQNNNPVYYCDGLLQNDTLGTTIPIEQIKCESLRGVWKTYIKGVPAPACEQVGWSRVNHLGNGRYGHPLHWNWTLPKYQTLLDSGNIEMAPGYIKCVARIRYNMSTDDYDPYNTFSDQDGRPDLGRVSPVLQDPTIDVGTETLTGLKLAVNTNQFGRTFQDRSHVFYIKKRPAIFNGKTIYNVNVKGKRGNVVQTFPSVQYDFMPNHLHLNKTDLIHLQWTGSNTHNNGNPAGDGQAGDDGVGKTGTDRHNFVLTSGPDGNYPVPLDKLTAADNFYQYIKCYDLFGNQIGGSGGTPWLDCALTLATSGQFRTKAQAEAATVAFDPYMDAAPASLVGGVVIALTGSQSIPLTGKEFHFMSSRNNNFGSRSEKGVFYVAGTDYPYPDYASLPPGS